MKIYNAIGNFIWSAFFFFANISEKLFSGLDSSANADVVTNYPLTEELVTQCINLILSVLSAIFISFSINFLKRKGFLKGTKNR